MPKKNYIDHASIEKFFKEYTQYLISEPVSNHTASVKGSEDYILEAENIGKLADTERYSQEIARMRQWVLRLYWEHQKDCDEIRSLRDELHIIKKTVQHHEKALRHYNVSFKKATTRIKKLQKYNIKSKKTVEELSTDVTQIKHIIACISFLSGICSMSDGLKEIARNWSKATKRKYKKHNLLNCAIIDGQYKEVE